MKLFNWNILAPINATTEAFPAVNPQWLTWEHRWPLIKARLLGENADIITLQEVDDISLADLEPFFTEQGYDYHTHVPDGQRRTGILTAAKMTDGNPNIKFVMRHIDARMMVVTVSLNSASGQRVRVVNFHLKAGAGNDEIRCQQIDSFFMTSPSADLIIAGDMNSEPNSTPLLALESKFEVRNAYDTRILHPGFEDKYTTMKVRKTC